MADDPMWCMVMFDLPTKTNNQKRAYQQFRNFLLDSGFVKCQYSVYAKFLPLGVISGRTIQAIKTMLPPQGEIRIIQVTDRQWANALRFFNSTEIVEEEEQDELLLF